jgi:putative ABC transport system permease protein
VVRVTVRSLLGHKLRLVLTAISIVLGVTFIAGTLVLTDTLSGTIASLYGNVYRHLDFEVQAPGVQNIPQAVLAEVRAVPGVAAAEGSVSGYAQFVQRDGMPVKTGLEPAIGLTFDPISRMSAFQLIAGRAPTSAHDVVMDAVTAQRYQFTVGDRVRILLPGSPQTFTITGIARLVGAGAVPGATFAAFNLPTAQRLFGAEGQVYAIDIATKAGADRATVARALERALPPGLDLLTGRQVARQQTDNSTQALAPVSLAMLIFGFIALFVGAFTIFNTFSIIVGQRTRELALLRVLGASRRQVFGSVLLESALVGVLASAVGIGLGVVVALALQALLSGLSVPLPAGPLVFGAGTVAAGLAVGVGVTVVATVNPAWRAVRIPPVAALVPLPPDEGVTGGRRLAIGGGGAILALVVLGFGLVTSSAIPTGLGAAGLFVAVAMLAPLAAGPAAQVLGLPLARVLGAAGRLGRANSVRDPRRTAQGATALMVGLAVVSSVSVLGASLAQSATNSVVNAVHADLLITSSSGTLSPSVIGLISSLPGVGRTCTVYGAQFEVRQQTVPIRGVCTRGLAQAVNLEMEAGSASRALGRGELLVSATTAKSEHLTTGSRLVVTFPDQPRAEVRVGGIFRPNSLIGSYLVGDAFFQAHFPGQLPGGILVDSRPGYPGLESTISRALRPYPTLTVESRAQFEAQQTAAINQALGLVYALLALAVVVAFIGIVNTLLLAVFERTREIGLLRAVGMQRRQIRQMVRTESVILSLFGALLGVLLGTGLGAALTFSLRQQQGLTAVIVPLSNLVAFVVIAAVLGLVAASWPARRAARLDILSAIAAQ